MSTLRSTLDQVKRKLDRYRGTREINEQDTKASLIQPVLRALGWDVEDLDEVRREYKRGKKDQPVDYALLLVREPCLFVEAKALGKTLDDRKWANQIMSYATVSGVEWAVLTDGDEYRIYNSHATVPMEEKLFRKVSISDDATNPEETLSLLSRERMEEKQINRLWEAHFVDRQVQAALQKLFAADPDPDPSLVRLLRKKIPSLKASDIKAGLRRTEARFGFPRTLEVASTTRTTPTKDTTRRKTARKKPSTKAYVGVSLADLIRARLLKPPLELTRHYKKHDMEAELRPDGTVVFQGNTYSSCSSAAEVARGTVTGRRMNTNGWTFWQYRDENGNLTELDTARQKYVKQNT